MMRRLVAVALALAIVQGCGPAPSDEPPPASATDPVPRPGAPGWAPLKAATGATEVPEGLADQPSLPDIEARSQAGGSRLDAERFALAVAQLLCDVRDPVDGARAIGSIAATSMDPTLKITLVNERNDQQAAGTLRRFDTTLDMWIRSEVVGSASSPSRVNVEIFGNVASDPMRYQVWSSTRYDVVREEDRWRLIGYHDGPSGPHTKRNLTPRQQHNYLIGPGWRRIPAAA